MEIEGGFSPDEEIGFGDFLVGGHLSLDALVDLVERPTPSEQALALSRWRTGNTDGRFKLLLGLSFEEKRNHNDRKRVLIVRPGFHLSSPEVADPRMQDFFKRCAGIRISEDDARQSIAAQTAVNSDDICAESSPDFFQSGLPWLDNLPGEVVGIHDRDGTGPEELGTRGFAHADAAR